MGHSLGEAFLYWSLYLSDACRVQIRSDLKARFKSETRGSSAVRTQSKFTSLSKMFVLNQVICKRY